MLPARVRRGIFCHIFFAFKYMEHAVVVVVVLIVCTGVGVGSAFGLCHDIALGQFLNAFPKQGGSCATLRDQTRTNLVSASLPKHVHAHRYQTSTRSGAGHDTFKAYPGGCNPLTCALIPLQHCAANVRYRSSHVDGHVTIFSIMRVWCLTHRGR